MDPSWDICIYILCMEVVFFFRFEGGDFGERLGKTSRFGADSFGRTHSGHWVWREIRGLRVGRFWDWTKIKAETSS